MQKATKNLLSQKARNSGGLCVEREPERARVTLFATTRAGEEVAGNHNRAKRLD
jgi:hypothetical protein